MEHEFSELAEEMSLTDGEGDVCVVEEEGEHGHEGEGEKAAGELNKRQCTVVYKWDFTKFIVIIVIDFPFY